MKLISTFILSVICLAFGLIPEGIMYFTWSLITPTEVWQKLVLLGLFWFGGASLCILFGFLAFAFWVACLSEITKSKYF